MVIYNVTAHIEPTIEQDWLAWMEEKHLPEMMATGKFTSAKVFKVITDQDTGGVSYAIQYHCENRDDYLSYLKENATALRKEGVDRYGDSVLYFRTELQHQFSNA